MSTMHAPRMLPQRGLRDPNQASRDGPGQQRRNLILLAVAGVVIVALVAFAVVRFWPTERAASPTNPATPFPTTLTVPALTAVYGDQGLILTALVGGGDMIVGEGDVTFTILAGDRQVVAPTSVKVGAGTASVTVPLPAALPAGDYTVRVDYGGGNGFGQSSTTANLTVAKRTTVVSLSALTLVQTYDGTAKGVTPLTDPADLAITLAYSRDGQPVAAPVGAGTYQVTATIDDPNYQGSVAGTLVIERALPTVAWQPPVGIVYGTPLGDAQLNATAALAGGFAYTPQPGAILPAGGGQSLKATFTPADTTNYRPVELSVPLTVTPAPLTVAASNLTRVYGAANPSLTATLRGFVNDETAAVLEGTPLVTTAAVPGSSVGTYAIAVTQGSLHAANYALNFVPGVLTITPAPLAVAAHDVTRVYGAPEPSFDGTLVGLVNDDPIAATYRTDAAISSPVGQYPIAPVLADPSGRLHNYLVTSTPGTLTVVPAQTAATVPELRADEGQTATLQANVQPVSPSIVTVDEGQVVFTVRQGTAIIAKTMSSPVQAGVATAAFPLGDLDAGDYTIEVAYASGENFADSNGTGALVVANVAPTAALFGPAAPVAEGDEFTVTVANPFDPSGADRAAGFTYAFDRGDGRGYGAATAVNTITRRALDDPGLTVRARIYDQHGAWTEYTLWVAVANVVPTVAPIVGPITPVPLGTPVTTSAAFNDPGVFDRHVGAWNWGDGVTTPAAIEAANGAGSAGGNHTYQQAGVYTITLTLSDDAQATAQLTLLYVVVDNADGGATAGIAWFESPVGAITGQPTQTGPAILAFVTGAEAGTVPQADAQILFRVGDLRFASASYGWLMTSGTTVQIEGVGTINGTGGYHFLLTASDGRLAGGSDLFRIVIWDQASGALVYDSQPGAALEAAPTMTPASGDIVIHPRQRDRISEAGQSLGDRVALFLLP